VRGERAADGAGSAKDRNSNRHWNTLFAFSICAADARHPS
jgi:hypothetical protein